MNKKIKAIFDEACRDHVIAVVEGKESDGNTPDKVQQRFAELIIQECISAVRENYVDRGTTEAVLSIEKHFGVK